MPAADEIPGIGKASLELLEAVGISNAGELAARDAESLADELGRANEVLAICGRAPGKARVAKWIAAASGLDEASSGGEDARSGADPRIPVNYEANPAVAGMLAKAPCAIPLPGRIMKEKDLGVSDVAAGLLLNRYSGDLEVRVDDSPATQPVSSIRRPTGNLETIEMKAGRRQFETSSVKRMEPSATAGKKIPKSVPNGEMDRVSLIRAPREHINRGKDPESRGFVRGVLHSHPWSLRTGAVFTLLLLANLPLAVIAAFLLLLSREFPQTFPWAPEWLLAFPAILPLIGLGYFFWGISGKCRVCNQKLFVRNRARQHIKGHRIPGFGYVVPLCLHLLLYSWFRCSSCGTPVRLKK